MRFSGLIVLLVVAVSGGEAAAETLTSSIRPAPRPQLAAPTAVVAAKEPAAAVAPGAQIAPRIQASIRPRPRPGYVAKPALGQTKLAKAPQAQTPEAQTPQAKPLKKGKATMAGAVCGDPAIKGTALPPVTSRTKGCGIAEPVKVTSISGVRFSQPATIDCGTAKAFKTWIEKGMRPAFGNREVVGLHIFGSYSCRSRNNVRGARVSEHGRGKAIDVAGFIFSNGQEWTIKRDYNKTIRKAHKAACGIFGTTLGPGSDGYHEDHLHFDTAKHRGGSYCR